MELEIKDTTANERSDILVGLKIKLHDKREDFDFPYENFQLMFINNQTAFKDGL